MKTRWFVGERVAATQTVYDNPDRKDETGPFPAAGYIHALTGDVGVVEHVYEDGSNPTVRFVRTGSATLVAESEIDKVCI